MVSIVLLDLLEQKHCESVKLEDMCHLELSSGVCSTTDESVQPSLEGPSSERAQRASEFQNPLRSMGH